MTWTLSFPDQAATERFARIFAATLKPGDLVTLSGDLGAGKTTFVRAVIRALCDDPLLEVPSPTFTLLQSYQGPQGVIVHADLFRIESPEELAELGWEEASDNAIVLVEWPERAGAALSADRWDISLTITGAQSRAMTITGYGSVAKRLAGVKAIQGLLESCGFADARRQIIQGDASTRAYERLSRDGGTAILMIAPRQPDGPPIRRGKPYSAIAKLAESVHAFVAVAKGLHGLGYSAPRIMGCDLDAGLVLCEDLGALPVVENGAPVLERYMIATEILADLHGRDLPQTLPVLGGIEHAIPRYDMDAALIEAELLLDWYAPYQAGLSVSAVARNAFTQAWRSVLEPILNGPTTWVLRDYHSPNLIHLPERTGLNRIGLIDFQDAVLGPPAYDLASLLQDARVDVPDDVELRLLSAYVRQRRSDDASFDMAGFTAAYAVMAAQRATKILGIFARLDRRDGKSGYLRHLPRLMRYLRKNLNHPALEPVHAWCLTHMPALVEEP